MRNWLRNKLHNFLFPADESSKQSNHIVGLAVSRDSDVDVDAGVRFTVMNARGGTIVQVRSYDRRKDESNTVTHIIPENESLSERIGQIVSMEMMAR